ncbi:hypothetical protein JJE66_22775 [Bradyrhizobium diazoefficiens]|uniref:hypothetical protein n=1 Tax=Bradyrhizobium diazoefficiens TaxID=1355477 RepID=UPI00190A924F|nr:hypothetical protein [Bradyrhizobium diazoefficiens]MBK3664034.1 hypothetical protein [Bradyrhizobium diazoefficiens]
MAHQHVVRLLRLLLVVIRLPVIWRGRCGISPYLSRGLRLGAFAAFAVATGLPATAHVHVGPDSATTSWYPRDCCHDGDCHPVSELKALGDGLVMTTDDGATVFVPSRSARRPSLDSRWHVCFDPGEKPAILCIFEPANS